MAEQREALGLGPVLSGSRTKPDGSEISWKFTDPYAMPIDGAIPFFTQTHCSPMQTLRYGYRDNAEFKLNVFPGETY